MLRWLSFLVLIIIVVVAVSHMNTSEKNEKEKQFQATLAAYQAALKSGSNRSQLEEYLQKQNMSFIQQAASDRAKLGEQPRDLFCNPWKVYLDFQFKSSEASTNAAHGNDVLDSIDLHREGSCF